MEKRLTPTVAHTALDAARAEFQLLFSHGTLEVEFYRPCGIDKQKPHTRDEVYVVIAGCGEFVCGATRQPFVTGEVLFVPARIEHRFEKFSADFCAWVFFYGPDGGERQ